MAYESVAFEPFPFRVPKRELDRKRLVGYKQVAKIKGRYFSIYAGTNVEYALGATLAFDAPGLSFCSTISTAREDPVGKYDFEKFGFRFGDAVNVVLLKAKCGGSMEQINRNRFFCTEVTFVSEIQQTKLDQTAYPNGSPHKCDWTAIFTPPRWTTLEEAVAELGGLSSMTVGGFLEASSRANGVYQAQGLHGGSPYYKHADTEMFLFRRRTRWCIADCLDGREEHVWAFLDDASHDQLPKEKPPSGWYVLRSLDVSEGRPMGEPFANAGGQLPTLARADSITMQGDIYFVFANESYHESPTVPCQKLVLSKSFRDDYGHDSRTWTFPEGLSVGKQVLLQWSSSEMCRFDNQKGSGTVSEVTQGGAKVNLTEGEASHLSFRVGEYEINFSQFEVTEGRLPVSGD